MASTASPAFASRRTALAVTVQIYAAQSLSCEIEGNSETTTAAASGRGGGGKALASARFNKQAAHNTRGGRISLIAGTTNPGPAVRRSIAATGR